MKKILLFFFFFFIVPIVAQDKKMTTNGIITFEASVPFYEAVEAKNNKVFAFLNSKNGNINFVAGIKNFHFERSLMEDHFNANYMESKKYPKATFKGQIEKFSIARINAIPTEHIIKGRMNMHGVTKNIRVMAKISKTPENNIVIQSDFSLNTDDFKIEIPFIVRSKISKTVNVNVNCTLQ
ncbi:YceI family protein [Flavobacterium daejeonense]|uniref:YceI family protein n=1 Tax=Flavobacterium daejeonense TaxID=350893 RepID=UPI00047AB29A|nr:YceI family protein [Flavobacterium daejeonense]